ncbi:hypothetical protein G4B88_030236 [Cannabis sativa]|uniref:DUF8039 domain-containing protein n=1 Tax=Cannabis sativa TaxID=3483 RepID=A0A7J6DJ07_CANSA|nr:hypothetical protein G4B88_030236 [Cannabis sativa]
MSSSTRKGSLKRGRTDTSDQPLSSTRRFSSKRAHNDTQSPSDSPQTLTPSTDDPSTVPLHDEQRQSSKEIQKNVRGPTRGDRLSRELKNDKITNLTITYNKGELQDVFKLDFAKDPYLEKKSMAGSKNRSKVKFMHRGGSKSFTQHLHETKSTPVMDVDEGQSKSIKKEMIELREDQLHQLEAGTLIMVDEAAIYRQVLGDAKYGWLRGTGPDKTYRLTLRDGDVVAIGEIFPGKQVHGKDLEKGNVRVRIIECLNENARLPAHVRDDLIFVKDAVESFVAWPKHLIIFGDSEALKTMEKNEHLSPHMPTQKASTSSMNVKDSPLPFVMPKIIPRSVKAILLSVQYRKSRDEYRIEMDPNIFGSDQDLYIEPKDIVDFGTNVEIGAGCIAFYISGILCAAKCRINSRSISKRSAAQMQLSLIPINLGIFDYYNASKKKIPRAGGIIWKIIKCPQQPKNFEYEYYVMKYMRDLYMDLRPLNWLNTNCNNRMENYTNEEIDEIRID